MDAVRSGEKEERRGAPRRRVLTSAQIVYHQDRIALNCVLRNISETGAQLATEGSLELPPSFWLRLHEGLKRPVELVWIKENLLGVRFIDVQDPEKGAQKSSAQVRAGAGVKAELVARIVEIERQLAELRAEITINLRD